jgi:hypothetical protein
MIMLKLDFAPVCTAPNFAYHGICKSSLNDLGTRQDKWVLFALADKFSPKLEVRMRH